MKKTHKLALVATFVTFAAAGCNSFLTGDCVSNSCNQPTSATADQLFIGVQVGVMGNWETFPMNLLPLWAQQIAGVNRQWASYSNYGSGTDDLTSDPLWISMYASGGLADIRSGEAQATTAGNFKAVGQFQVIEALTIGTITDLWGDVPFDSAGTPFPTFDKQSDVYAHVQALLDSAIANLGGGGAPNTTDFYFGGDLTKWIATAHTLKARRERRSVLRQHEAEQRVDANGARNCEPRWGFRDGALGDDVRAEPLLRVPRRIACRRCRAFGAPHQSGEAVQRQRAARAALQQEQRGPVPWLVSGRVSRQQRVDVRAWSRV